MRIGYEIVPGIELRCAHGSHKPGLTWFDSKPRHWLYLTASLMWIPQQRVVARALVDLTTGALCYGKPRPTLRDR